MRIRNPKTGESYFSKRRRRYDEDRLPRSLTFSCYQGYRFLSSDRTRKWFIEALEQTRCDWPIDLWAYVIMPEHVHLLVSPHEPNVQVGRFAGRIKEQVSRKGIAWIEEHSPGWLPKITVYEGEKKRRRFWRPGGGFDRNVDDLNTLHAIIDYIHANPVRRGLAEQPDEWEWSSARFYEGIRPVQIEMDLTLPDIK